MKNETIFETADGKKLNLCFTIKSMRNMERELGQSLLFLVMQGRIKSMTIDFAVAGMKNSIEELKKDEDVYELIQNHCDAGGSIFDVIRSIEEALIATGIFTASKKEPAGEQAG
jgi:hypothetical protein